MVSNILNLHPRILSLSEFFSYVGEDELFRWPRVSGDWVWERLSHQSNRTRHMLWDTSFDEFTYPLGAPGARYTVEDVPPVLCAALPHITREHEALFDVLEGVVRGQRRQAPAAHLRHLFEWLCGRYDASVWVERSGSSLLWGHMLIREFPDARFVHVYRDGRETALSMHGHYLFRLIVAGLNEMRRRGINPATVLRGRSRWKRLGPFLIPLLSRLLKPERLRFDEISVVDCAELWNVSIEIGLQLLAQLPPGRVLSVRLEDMQAEPQTHVRRLIRFIDPSLEEDEWVRKASAIPRKVPLRFSKLDAGEQAAVTAACRPGLVRLGYAI